ncbi:helix-turn-helix domain-containing protein [Dactylosporangium sp. CA-092794]|uniref:helix-turn-helix domain-containing protein n=1 Tax=Dactylosporangium sp. CA-092794 TaxID=3239929 RepID=UPI003D90CEBD
MVESQDWSMVGDRIRAARVAAGLTQGDLGERIGLDRTMVAKIEAGTRRIDALELVRLSSALGLSMAHFLEPPPAVLSRRSVTLTDDTDSEVARESAALEAALAEWMRDLRQLIDSGHLALPPLLRYPQPVASVADARLAAGWVRRQLDIGDGPIESMLSLCERAGQFAVVTGVKGDGASAVDGALAAAVISVRGDPGRRRATAAHELGHLVLGDEYSSDLGVHASRADREAVIDAFAAELLVPVAAFAADAAASAPIARDRLLQVAARYRASWSLTCRQAEAAGVPPVPRRWLQSAPTRAEFLEALGFTPPPDLESVRVPPAYAKAVLRAWRDDLITRARTIELMRGQLQDQDLPADPDADLAP